MMPTVPSSFVLAVAALAALLVPPVPGTRRPVGHTLFLVGAANGAVLTHGLVQLVLLALLIGRLLVWCARASTLTSRQRRWGTGVYTLALSAALVAAMTDGPVSATAALIACATLLPLFPLHGGYLAAIAAADGPLATALAVAAPLAGLHGMLDRLGALPPAALETVAILALAGALYGSLKALVQSRAVPLITYAGVAFFAMLWWYLAAVAVPTHHAVLYGAAVALVVAGLLLAWEMVQARYGDIGLDQIGGLARTMPRFGFLFTVLTSAAMGLPPFGVFAAFIGMLLTPLFVPSGGLFVLLLAWLSASWYFLAMLQRVLFGPHRRDLLYDDLRAAEAASLGLVVAALLVLGLWPLHERDTGGAASTYTSAAVPPREVTWSR